MNRKRIFVYFLILLAIALIVTLLLKHKDILPPLYSLISNTTITPPPISALDKDSKIQPGVYTISGKIGFLDISNMDAPDNRQIDSKDPRSLTTFTTRPQSMPMTLSWVFLNPSAASSAVDKNKNPINFTIPIGNKHFAYTLTNGSNGPQNITFSPVDSPNPAFVSYNLSTPPAPINPPIEINTKNGLDKLTFMIMFHIWMLKTQNFDSIKGELYYNSFTGENIYDIINNSNNTPIATDNLVIQESYYDWGEVKYDWHNHPLLINRSTSNINADIVSPSNSGTLTFVQSDDGYNSQDFTIYKGALSVDSTNAINPCPIQLSKTIFTGPSNFGEPFGLAYRHDNKGNDGAHHCYYYIGGYNFSMTNPILDSTNDILLLNSVNSIANNLNSWSSSRNDQFNYTDNSSLGTPPKKYYLWINPFASPDKYVKQFIEQDPYLQFLFFTRADVFIDPSQNLLSKANVQIDLLNFVKSLYPDTSHPINQHAVKWISNELCNNNSGFLYEDTSYFCACQPEYKHTNQTEKSIADIYKLAKGTDMPLRCAYSSCNNDTSLHSITVTSNPPACSSFCGVVTIENAQGGSAIENNNVYNISCGDDPKSSTLICGQPCIDSKGTCPSSCDGSNCPQITTPTCKCPSGSRSSVDSKGNAICIPDDKPSQQQYACDPTTKKCSVSSTGTFTSLDSCNSSCSGSQPVITKYSCNSDGNCVPDIGGSYTTQNCDNKCVSPKPPLPTPSLPVGWIVGIVIGSILLIVALYFMIKTIRQKPTQ